MTPQERKLWYEFLRELPIRFQRQKTIKNYIVDFYCHKAGLVIEIDGSQHYEEKEALYDIKRTEELEELGLKVIRYSNYDINTSFEAVCRHILLELGKRTILPQTLDEDAPSVSTSPPP